MSKEKVVLPKEVAEVFEKVLADRRRLYFEEDLVVGMTDWTILMQRYSTGDFVILLELFKSNPTEYISAIEDGYEVEETPEDKLRKYFGRLARRSNVGWRDGFYEEKGVRTTLDILGITIEGINDTSRTPKAKCVTGEEPFDLYGE